MLIYAREHACPLLYTIKETVRSLKQTGTLPAGFRAVGLVEGSSQTMRKLDGMLIRPAVDEEEMMRIRKNVTVQDGGLNAFLTQPPSEQTEFFGARAKFNRQHTASRARSQR